jgi:hypothetical protein
MAAVAGSISGRGRYDLKLQRACRHLEELREAIEAYRCSDVYRTVATVTAPNVVEYTLDVREPPALEEWALIFGDSVHNIRAALDHLAWQLACAPKAGPGGTAFPVFAERPKKGATNWPQLASMPTDAQMTIEQLQPYARAEASERPVELDPLHALHHLDISDKHRVLTVTAGALAGQSVSGGLWGASIEYGAWQPFVTGVAVARVRLPADSPSPTGLEVGVSFDVVLVEPPWTNANVLWVLEGMLLPYVRDTVIPALAPFAR